MTPFAVRSQSVSRSCLGCFEGMWFAFPTPFKRGDLVCQKHSLKAWRFPQNVCYVLDSITAWTNREMRKADFGEFVLIRRIWIACTKYF